MTAITPLPDLASMPESAAPESDERALVGYRRTPRDLYRAVVYLGIALIVLVPTLWVEDSILGFEEDIVRLATVLNAEAERIFVGVLQVLVGVASLGVIVTPIVQRRFRLLGYVVLANLLSGGLAEFLHRALDHGVTEYVRNEIARPGGIGVEAYPSPAALAQLVAAFVVVGPFVSGRWRRFGAGFLAVMVFLRLVVSTELPVPIFLSLSLGAMLGALILYAFGRPDDRPTEHSVLRGLRAAGLPVATLDHADVDARGSVPYFGTLETGDRLFAKVLGTQERSADLLFRLYRYLRYRNLGDERPFSSLRRTVEHEAFVALEARDLGVRTPRMRGVVGLGPDCFLLAYDGVNGRTLDRLDDAEVTDEVVRALWEQVRILRDHRIAHRDLRRANVLAGDDGQLWIIDFGFAEVAASDDLLAADIAQVCSALAVVVGAERAVDIGVDVLGPQAFGDALPRLQIGALSGATQSALKQHKGLLDEIHERIKARTGIEEVKFEPIQRVSAKQLFTVAMLVAVTYFLLPQFADLPEVWNQVRDANWWWFVPLMAASVITYFGATLSFLGSVPSRLAMFPTLMTQTASSFVSKVAPAGLGGMALNIRYAQKSGVDGAVAVSAVGLNSLAGFVMHIVLLLLFLVWAGRTAFRSIRFPDPHNLLLGAAAVLVFSGAAFAVPAVRRLIVTKLVPILSRAFGAVRALARQPMKLLLLFGGSAVVSMSYVVALYFATRAFGGTLSFAAVGTAYLAGSAIATAAPTPGGLGAVEAALVAGLTAAGMPGPVALPSVFLMRFGTFWIPILPGWAAFTWLRRTEHI